MNKYSNSRESLLRWHEEHNVLVQDCPHCEVDKLKAREVGFIKLRAENAKLRELLVGLYSESYIESELASAGNTAIIY